MKSFSSGDDLEQARQTHKDQRGFQIQASEMICTDFSEVKPAETCEILEGFEFECQSVSCEQMVGEHDFCPRRTTCQS